MSLFCYICLENVFFSHFERKLITTMTTWLKPVNMEPFFTMYFYSKPFMLYPSWST